VGRTLSRPAAGSGVLLAAAGVWAVGRERAVPSGVVLAMLAAAAAAALARSGRLGTVAAVVIAAVGGALVAVDDAVPDVGWLRVAVAVMASAGALAAASFERRWSRCAVTPALFAVTVLGAFLCVPDTEEIRALLPVAGAAAALGWPLRLATLGTSGIAAGVCLLAWVGAYDARGRPASFVGVLGCLGLLAGASLLRRVPGRGRAVVLVVAGHAALVAWSARVAGVRDDATTALLLLLPAAAAAAGFHWLLQRAVVDAERMRA